MKSRTDLDGRGVSQMVAPGGRYKFHTKAGWLKPYALACGYVEKTVICDDVQVELYSPAGTGQYVVRADGPADVRRHMDNYGAYLWFERLTDARKYFRFCVRDAYKAVGLAVLLD